MILIGAFGLFWFGKSKPVLFDFHHSAGLPRCQVFCLRRRLRCRPVAGSVLPKGSAQGPRAPGVADKDCTVIHVIRDY